MRNEEESLERTIMAHNMGGAYLDSDLFGPHLKLPTEI